MWEFIDNKYRFDFDGGYISISQKGVNEYLWEISEDLTESVFSMTASSFEEAKKASVRELRSMMIDWIQSCSSILSELQDLESYQENHDLEK